MGYYTLEKFWARQKKFIIHSLFGSPCIYSILSSKLTFKSWILTSKKKNQVARIGVRGGGGFRWFGQCPKENVFFSIEAFPNVEESCLEGPTWNREDMNNKEVATTSSGCKFWQTNPLVLLWYIKCQDQSVSSACSGLHHSLILCTLYPKFCVCAWHKLEIWVGTGGQKYECCE